MKFDNMYVAVDCETGGLTATSAALVEIACAPFSMDLNNLPEYTSGAIAPYNSALVYTPEALAVNKISIDQIKQGRPSVAVVNDLVGLFSSLKRGREKPVIIAHNLKFDYSFLSEFFAFHKRNIDDFINTEFSIDTMYWGRLKWIENINFKLGSCCERAGIETDTQHRAISDVRVTRDLAKYFISCLRNESKGQSVEKSRETFQM